MNFTLILFYLFSFILITSALVVVNARNTIYSALFLILAFLNAAALFILLGAEFLATLLVVVYVGAIAVLFLFVVMMLNIDRAQVKNKISKNLPLLLIISGLMFFEIFIVVKISALSAKILPLFPTPVDIHNTKALGNILYTDFIYPFQICGLILFVAMIGAIILTMRDKTSLAKKQNIFNQLSRNKENSLQNIKVKSGEGINI
jgi:NADH-quinone oxidoreductase subunit J